MRCEKKPKPGRKIMCYDDPQKGLWSYLNGRRNPCGCGSNCFHYEYDGEEVIGVCNGCWKDIYVVKPEYRQEYLKKGRWEDACREENTENKKTVFVYKKYRDDQSYGEEDIRVFLTREKALEQLRCDMEKHCQCSWDEIPEKLQLTDDDVFEPDYVSIIISGSAACYWIIEECPLEG